MTDTTSPAPTAIVPAEIALHVLAGGDKPLLISGPCVLQEQEVVFRIADRVAAIAAELAWPLVFKASFDKANRTLDFFATRVRASMKACTCYSRSKSAPVYQ